MPPTALDKVTVKLSSQLGDRIAGDVERDRGAGLAVGEVDAAGKELAGGEIIGRAPLNAPVPKLTV